MISRRKTRQVRVGGVKIGGHAPVSIQSMIKSPTSDIEAVINQARALKRCGCDIIRVAVKDMRDADAIRKIKKRVDMPLVADIHFDYRLALKSISSGADKVRLNPGNIRRAQDVAEVVRAAKKARIPVRIGVNSGSVVKADEKNSPGLLVKAALGYIKIFEELDFYDIIVSLKSSDVVSTVASYRNIAGKCDYPLHLGVTAAGPYDSGVIKSSVGIGSLLLDGIGDTIRVSLTADPVEEVITAKRMLGALGLKSIGADVISCPTCGRCRVDLGVIVKDLEHRLSAISFKSSAKKALTIAVMGCEVNGPGEAREADIGIAAGKGSGILFRKGKIIKRIEEKDFIKEILKLIKLS